MDPKDRRVTIRPEEMESLLNLKFRIDYQETVASYAEKYQQLGWVLQAVNPQEGADLEVDSGENPGIWDNRGWEPGLSGPEISLAVCTGKRSRLMVLEVAKGAGELILDQYGQWRAHCIAVLETGRERHFYAWDPSTLFDSTSFRATPEIRWFGEGQVVPVPPSGDAETGVPWRWLSPPWESPLQSPSQSLSRFLQHHLTREVQPAVSLSWQEVYCLVSPYEPLLQALSASHPSMQNYYQGILAAAVAAGIMAPEALLSLLWHAPRGNARQHPAIWGHLQQLVAATQDHPGPVTSPEPAPWELFLNDALSLARETSAGSSGQGANKPGPPCFLQRRLAQPPQPGAAKRNPFSCRKIRGDMTKILMSADRGNFREP
jgi:hypothetical protein